MPVRQAITPTFETICGRWECKLVTTLKEAAPACAWLAWIHCLPFACRGTFPRAWVGWLGARCGQWEPLVGDWMAGGRERPGYRLCSHSAFSLVSGGSVSFWLQLLPVDRAPELWKDLLPVTLQFRSGSSLFLWLISALSYHFLYDSQLFCCMCNQFLVLNSLYFNFLRAFCFSGWTRIDTGALGSSF